MTIIGVDSLKPNLLYPMWSALSLSCSESKENTADVLNSKIRPIVEER